MPNQPTIALLSWEMNDAWHTFTNAVQNLTETEFWWKPSANSWTLREINGRWALDYDQPTPIPPGPLTIAWLILHIATCKVMYVEYAFGPAKLTWDDLTLPSHMGGALRYLAESHRALETAIGHLRDNDLTVPRLTNWGEQWPTTRIIWTLIQHDVYHGAQIQAMRKLYRALHAEP